MSLLWIAVIAASVLSFVQKWIGYQAPQDVLERPRIARITRLSPIAPLGALVATQTAADGTEVVLDARLAGLGVAVVLAAGAGAVPGGRGRRRRGGGRAAGARLGLSAASCSSRRSAHRSPSRSPGLPARGRPTGQRRAASIARRVAMRAPLRSRGRVVGQGEAEPGAPLPLAAVLDRGARGLELGPGVLRLGVGRGLVPGGEVAGGHAEEHLAPGHPHGQHQRHHDADGQPVPEPSPGAHEAPGDPAQAPRIGRSDQNEPCDHQLLSHPCPRPGPQPRSM
ncbi:AzlD domain-containing protein [Brachybacterium sp. GPGPB12]|uniref:AzlD domain-containing protein n=1 Tax=Brachybacterium sp. GPGPB12 TaxID=3023517 RepID=UPI0031343E33